MRPPKMTPRWLLFCPALLTACAAAPPPPLPEPPPTALFDCPLAPAPPSLGATQRAAALFVLELSAAHGACRSQLGRLKTLLRPAD